MKIYLSVIIPCYNEEKNLKRGVLEEVESYLSQQQYASEVIITDDGSTDESPKLAENFVKNHPRFILLKNKHAGKPFALRAGLKKARGEIVLFTDMDQSAPISELEKLLPWFEKKFALVIGSRGKERKHFSWYRKMISTGFRSFRRMILLPQIVDTQCGFKAIKRQAALLIFDKMLIFRSQKKAAGWRVGAWDVEMLFVAKKKGYLIKEIRVDWQDKDVTRGKQRNYLKESKEMLAEVLRVRLNDLLGRYQ
ncbi:MAG: glycosyltransferase [Candidatus Marinimicrobia bacterium]|nr:glycosyltransferase [Candidatus Neomarinimicrobiota bacterium]